MNTAWQEVTTFETYTPFRFAFRAIECYSNLEFADGSREYDIIVSWNDCFLISAAP